MQVLSIHSCALVSPRSIVCCCFLSYTLWTFPREHCIVLQGLKFTEDYICLSTAEQCSGM